MAAINSASLTFNPRRHTRKLAIIQGGVVVKFLGVAILDVRNDFLQKSVLLGPVGAVPVGYSG
jgi:hypothetical protein